ncbi:DUF1549 and DUF1553 domain-containing protein [Urbifossiella limnaea]|uniref:Cytochrome c domain-containing protein n=1 Tax=Urbifossiella limnaea TaxID=2528023 RepID=A0A517XZT6_9BACT|nr:DUF1549 and DUF1553 domain-containing protein [Urbifossiella limnaea]QDU23024.1 hypothetical protein ETAA1_50140 [Urbifossiella limnaea]
MTARLAAILALIALPSAARPADAPAFHFENDILPVLGRYGCSSSGCHGKSDGQGGFKLSVLGSDPDADFAALTKEARGRRLMPTSPDESLLLRKGSGRTAHGGGTKLPFGSDDYQTLRRWVAAGMPFGAADAPRVVGLRVEPAERVMGAKAEQQLKVIARYSDGGEKDVTRHARYQSNREAVAAVSADGRVSTLDVPGEAAVMAGYLGEVGVFRAVVPRPGPPVATDFPRFNAIDELVDRRLAKLNVTASPVCDDAEYLRRVYLDLTGTLPTPAAARRFLADTAADKRARLVEQLLTTPEFADLWAMRWADLLRVDRQALGPERARSYYGWVRRSVAENVPFDRFARELLTAEGPLAEVGPANFYQVVTKPGEMASNLAQVLLGVRIGCAECHHHPFDRWTQADYAGMVGFFTPVSARGGAVAAGPAATLKHPRTGQPVFAHALGSTPPASELAGDRREALADWMTRPDNPYFARNLSNRVWAWLLGVGIVEPVDDVRATNPPSNPELLDALARFTVENRYDVRKLIAFIAASRTYQASSRPNATNERDERNFSRALLKRPEAEVLLDMVSQATGVGEKFQGSPGVTRAVQLWDSKARHDFLKRFGRPSRVTACECERTREPSVAQVLTLLNSPDIQAKLNHEAGTVATLVRSQPDDAKLTEELYLTFFSRRPTTDETAVAVAHLRKHAADRRRGAEDLAWALLNSTEFLFNH